MIEKSVQDNLDLLTSCANCTQKFQDDSGRITRIYMRSKIKSQEEQQQEDPLKGQHHHEATSEMDTSAFHEGHLEESHPETLELSVVTLQESEETGELEVMGLERLDDVGVEGHHFQVSFFSISETDLMTGLILFFSGGR
jgi:hypothetical protein